MQHLTDIVRLISITNKTMTHSKKQKESIKNRLEYLRQEIRAERISYGEIAELQSLVKHINSNDVELLQWAGVEEN